MAATKPDTIILEGYLRKKGNHLYSYRFKKKYFYLDDRSLRFGDKKDEPTASVDLATGNVEVAVSSQYRTQFKVIFPHKGHFEKLRLKADSEAERDEWVGALRKVVEQHRLESDPQQPRYPNSGLNKHLTLNYISDSLLQYKD